MQLLGIIYRLVCVLWFFAIWGGLLFGFILFVNPSSSFRPLFYMCAWMVLGPIFLAVAYGIIRYIITGEVKQ